MKRSAPPATKRRLIKVAATALVFAACGAGLWQSDWVRQNVQIEWLAITGQSWRLRGSVRTVSMWSPALGASRNVIVYTPPNYDAAASRSLRYPVLYLLHGMPGNPNDWLRYGRALEVVERLVAQRSLSPLIVVCPDGHGDGYLGDSEYLDAPVSPSGKGRGKKIGTFIARDLVAWVDLHFRTVAAPRGRILGGVSTGGYGAVNLGLTYPSTFGSLLSFSGYYTASQSGWARPVWGRHPSPAVLRSQSPQEYVNGPRPEWSGLWVYLADGRNERGPYAAEGEAFALRLRAAGIDCAHVETPGRHSWDLWRPQLRDALIQADGRIKGAAD